MGAEENVRAAPRRPAVIHRALAARRAQDRRFWIGVACAAIVHAALLIGVATSSPSRQIGEQAASPEGIAVELVDAADLDSRSTVAPETPPASTGSLAQQPQRQQPPQPQEEVEPSQAP